MGGGVREQPSDDVDGVGQNLAVLGSQPGKPRVAIFSIAHPEPETIYPEYQKTLKTDPARALNTVEAPRVSQATNPDTGQLDLVRVHRALASQGYGLLVHDAYRPWWVTKIFWEATPPALREFVADPAQGSRHNRGCAVDRGHAGPHRGLSRR